MVDSQRMENLVKWRQAAVMTRQWRLVNPSPDGAPGKLELYDVAKDPAQLNNVAAAHPQVVAQLKAEYDAWWTKVSANSAEPVRIVIGHPSENPTRLTSHDWHGEGAEAVWNQAAIRAAPLANGTWALQAGRPGAYRFELCRWPKEVGLPINAPLPADADNRETTPGVAISAVKARIKAGVIDQSAPITGDEPAAIFTLNLEAGPLDLQTWFIDEAGGARGAYYVYVTRL